MNGLFYNVLNKVIGFLGVDGIFVVSFSLLSLTFVLSLILMRVKKIEGFKSRLWFLFVTIGLTTVQAGVEILFGGFGFSVITLGVSFIYCAVLFFPVKSHKYTPEQIDLARKLIEKSDEKTLKDTNAVKEKPVEKIRVKEKNSLDENVSDRELDFLHVKNVLKRMEYYTLSQNDRRQVKDLESAIVEAERGELTYEIKRRINDGLGALLKLMSKYGI
jgi:hypothetical protein